MHLHLDTPHCVVCCHNVCWLSAVCAQFLACLAYPPYSPHLALCDFPFSLFSIMKIKLKGQWLTPWKRFRSGSAEHSDKEGLLEVFLSWHRHWNHGIHFQRDYSEGGGMWIWSIIAIFFSKKYILGLAPHTLTWQTSSADKPSTHSSNHPIVWLVYMNKNSREMDLRP